MIAHHLNPHDNIDHKNIAILVEFEDDDKGKDINAVIKALENVNVVFINEEDRS